MNYRELKRRAERLLDDSDVISGPDAARRARLVATAQVYAILALAEVVGVIVPVVHPTRPEPESD